MGADDRIHRSAERDAFGSAKLGKDALVRFRDKARLDTGQVRDRRGAGGGLGGLPMAIGGGGGIVGLIVVLLLTFAGGGGGGTGGLSLGGGEAAENDLSSECVTGADANQRDDCRIVAVVNSVQAHWTDAFGEYRPADTVFFSGQVSTACGNATSAVGPFYCPGDETIYIDLTFYDELRSRFGAQGGTFAEAYVIAHEYGHHVEHILGVLDRARDGSTGPSSSGVRVELMADCLAGVWARNAVDTEFVEAISDADVADGLDAAATIGDDRIQEQTSGQVQPELWTHGSSEQRQKWFLTGYREGTLDDCDTFAVANP
jgi:predicted metalloprotease